MLRLWTAIQSRLTKEDGATMVEYALLVALIALVVIVGAAVLGNAISDQFTSTGGTVSGVGG